MASAACRCILISNTVQKRMSLAMQAAKQYLLPFLSHMNPIVMRHTEHRCDAECS